MMGDDMPASRAQAGEGKSVDVNLSFTRPMAAMVMPPGYETGRRRARSPGRHRICGRRRGSVRCNRRRSLRRAGAAAAQTQPARRRRSKRSKAMALRTSRRGRPRRIFSSAARIAGRELLVGAAAARGLGACRRVRAHADADGSVDAHCVRGAVAALVAAGGAGASAVADCEASLEDRERREDPRPDRRRDRRRWSRCSSFSGRARRTRSTAERRRPPTASGAGASGSAGARQERRRACSEQDAPVASGSAASCSAAGDGERGERGGAGRSAGRRAWRDRESSVRLSPGSGSEDRRRRSRRRSAIDR